jgi:hypothetical protein
MVRMVGFAVGLCVSSMVASAQEDPAAWLPIQVGSRWVYEHESKSGDRNRPDVDRWTTEESITGRVTIPEGLVVLRDVKQLGNPDEQTVTVRMILPNGQSGSVQQPSYNRCVYSDPEPYLVRGNCIYGMAGGWDSQVRQLRPEYRKYLIEGAVSPHFCFPLQMGREWGNNDIRWRVELAREGVGSFLPAEYAGAIHIFSSHFGSGGWKDVWFQEGVGIVGEHYIHNGTYDEYTTKLLSFSH